MGVLGQVWYLIVLITNLCRFSYFVLEMFCLVLDFVCRDALRPSRQLFSLDDSLSSWVEQIL